MKKSHNFGRNMMILVLSVMMLLTTSNVVFARSRTIRSHVNRPRIHRVVQRRVNRRRNVLKSKNNGRYNVFQNNAWRNFKVVKNSTRVNSRVPRLHLLKTFPNVYRGGRWPQSLNVDKNGHFAFIGFDSFANDGSKLLKFNLHSRHFNKTSKTFSAGHAQAVSTDGNNNIWFINRHSNDEGGDHQGPVNKGTFVEVSPNSLKPKFYKSFKFGNNFMGDNLAFAGNYGVFNVSRIWGRNHTNNHFRRHMLVIYHTNNLNRHGSLWQPVGALRHTSGFYLIQAVAYNPRSQRLYIASDQPTEIMSIPVPKLMKHALKKHDVRVATVRLRYGREIEGLAFDRKGYMYMLLGSPGQILKSRRPVTK